MTVMALLPLNAVRWDKIAFSSKSAGRYTVGTSIKVQLPLNQEGEVPEGPGHDDELAVQESKAKLKPPPMFRVIMLNDDYTPMDFVVEVLESFFAMSREKATQVMLTVHTQGKAICGVFTRDIAETKATQVNQYARENSHPLMCEIDEAE